ncbi:hypothetical protein [Aquirhabdus sp.]|uniref:hypothetical protein n=1 Tax=Aquirhabdus sp. TaxID=2824160 RepID=UPI00396C3BC6
MKNKLIFLFLAQLLCLWQCAFADTSDVNYLKDKSRIESIVGGFYEGRFSDGTPFQMTLFYSKDNPSTYQYPRQFKGEVINLEQTTFHGNSFKLSMKYIIADNAYPKGKVLYKEQFTGKLSKDKKTASGIWTHSANKKERKLRFSMRKLITYKEISVTHKSIFASQTLTPEEAEWIDPTRPFTFNAIVPILKDEKINEAGLENASLCEFDQECSNSILVVGHYNNLMSLSSGNSGYDAGNAHGHYGSILRHYVSTHDVSNEVFLDYFFKTSSSCLTTLSNLIRSDLEKEQVSSAEGFRMTETDYKDIKFIPTPLGLAFVFDPEELGGYGEGSPSVFIAKESIKQCLIYLPESK